MTHGLRRFHVGDRLSEMTIFNGTVYLAGQVAADATQDIRGQTRQVLAAIDKLLAEAGTDNAHILMAQIFLPDLADFAAMNALVGFLTENCCGRGVAGCVPQDTPAARDELPSTPRRKAAR